MIKIEKQLVSNAIVNSRSHGYGNTKKFIAIHETANTSNGANAQAHANLQTNGNRREASWHYQVDDKRIIQSFDDNVKCWHVGNSNHQAIAIEICVNNDGNYKKAVKNAAELTKYLMRKYKISINNVKQHNYFTGKNCPTFMRSNSKGINWSDFQNMIGKTTPVAIKPVTSGKSIAEMAHEVYLGLHGNGHNNRIKSLGISNNEYEKVKAKVAELVKGKSASKPKAKPKKTIGQMAKEVIAGKHGNGHANRQKSLGISKSDYELVKKEVNRLSICSNKSKPKSSKKSNDTIAKEVMAGKWGNGETRKSKLKAAGYNPSTIQNLVNKLSGGSPAKPKGKSVTQIAREVIRGDWGNGATRTNRLRKAGYNPSTIQKEVNRLLK